MLQHSFFPAAAGLSSRFKQALRRLGVFFCQRAWNNNPLWATKNNPLLQERGYQHASRTCIVPSGDVVGRRTNGQG